MNLKDGTVKSTKYMSADNGSLDLPMYNHKYDGVKNCFTYLTNFMGGETMDENYSFPIYKYDSCKGEIAGKWE